MQQKQEAPAVVIDNGSYMCKAGVTGDEGPRTIFPTIIGRPKMPSLMAEMDLKDCYVGKEAQNKSDRLAIGHPVKQGIITNWDDMEKIWHHCLYDMLRISPEESPVLLTEAPLNPKANREKMCQIMFENFKFPYFYVETSAALSLYASGRTTGIVFDAGEDGSDVVPIHQGRPVEQSIIRSEAAGRDLTDYLHFLLAQSSFQIFTLKQERIALYSIKEKHCYIAEDFEAEIEKHCKFSAGQEVKLPDGKTITLSTEKFRCPEALFDASLIKDNEVGIHQRIFNSICHAVKHSKNEAADFYENIVLAGGTSMFPGIKERLLKELLYLDPSSKTINIIAPENRNETAWIGGSILSSLSSFKSMWITRSEFDEVGPSICRRIL